MATWPQSVSDGDVIEISHHNGLRDNVVRKKTALEGQLFYTQGSIPFADSSGFLDENNSKLFWDSGNARLGVGTVSPAVALHVEVAATSLLKLVNSGAGLCSIEIDANAGSQSWQFGVLGSDRFAITPTGTLGAPILAVTTDGVDIDGNVSLQELSVTPANPGNGVTVRQYFKDDKVIFQYNQAGTIRYKYLDMTGTGVTWVHTTTAP